MNTCMMANQVFTQAQMIIKMDCSQKQASSLFHTAQSFSIINNSPSAAQPVQLA